MLTKLIEFSLRHRPIVLALAILLLVLGVQTTRELPVEVLPDMTKPTVTILTECPGLAPEEVEALVTQPIEAAVQGVGGLDRLRSNSDVSLSLVFAEFAWNTDIYRARQLVQERLQAVAGNFPEGIRPGLHQNYLGGLLEHTLSLVQLVLKNVSHCSGVNLDLLLTASILHDLGKVDELSYHRSFDYSDEGRLLGHIIRNRKGEG